MHQLYSIIQGVEETHPGLGNAIAFSIVCVKAKMCLLIVAPAGCGKSAITEGVSKSYPDSIKPDSVTRASLSKLQDTLTQYQGLVIIDDMGKIDGTYHRKHTLTAFAELCYSHFICKYTYDYVIEINDFQGSAILNVQPPILAEIYQYPEWEVVLQDKTLRYYHLYRPTKPNDNKPNPKIDWGISIDLVHKPKHTYKLYPKLEDIAAVQWSDARVLEHLDGLLKASAALDGRQNVTNTDMLLLHRLMKPMVIERYVCHKTGFEVGRWMNTNLMAVLVEYASWRNLSFERICRDYKISLSTVYRLLSEIDEWFVKDPTQQKHLIPKRELTRVLKEAGVER